MKNAFRFQNADQRVTLVVRQDQLRARLKKRAAIGGNVPCHDSQNIAVAKQQRAEVRLTKPRRALKHGVKHWRQISGRRGNDAQYIGRRRLLFEGFAQLGKQPRVLNGDDGLIGEARDQRDLLVSKRPHFLAIKRQ